MNTKSTIQDDMPVEKFDTRVDLGRKLDKLSEYLSDYSPTPQSHSVGYISHIVSYAMCLPVGLLLAFLGGAISGILARAMAYTIANFYELVTFSTGYGENQNVAYTDISSFMSATSLVGAAFGAALCFCVTVLRILRFKDALQSVVVLEIVALVGVLYVAGDMQRTVNYDDFFTGVGVIAAVLTLVLARPNWVYLDLSYG